MQIFFYQNVTQFTESAVMAALAFAFIISFFGIGMGVILLKGFNQVSVATSWNESVNDKGLHLQKRASYIKAWLIYGITAFVVSIIGIILNSSGTSIGATTGTAVISGILGIAVNLFSIIVVYIHMKEINEGVFIP